MITGKLTSKAQTTIPLPVRAALHLEEGDELTQRGSLPGKIRAQKAGPPNGRNP
jgi:antitoxin PrlF